MSERTLQVREHGLAIFRGWAAELEAAEARGEDPPQVQDLDAVIDWLDDRGLIEPPVDREQARVLIGLCLLGGVAQVRSGP